MSILVDLLNEISQAQDKVDEAEYARDAFLNPILTALGATGGGISRCHKSGDTLYIERTGSCRGCRWDNDYRFPLAIFTCDDPIKAATEYMTAQKKAKEDAERLEKLQTIQRLQKELAK